MASGGPINDAAIGTSRSSSEYQQHYFGKFLSKWAWRVAWPAAAGAVTLLTATLLFTTAKQWKVLALTGKALLKAMTGHVSDLLGYAVWKSALILAQPWISLPTLAAAYAVWRFMIKHEREKEGELYDITHIRGSQIVSEVELRKEVDDRAPSIARSIKLNELIGGSIPGFQAMDIEQQDDAVIERKLEMSEDQLAAAVKRANELVSDRALDEWRKERVLVGEVPIPPQMEMRNVMMVGAVGTGKSVAIKRMLKRIEAALQAAIVYDPTGEYVAHFYDPSRGDVILSPILDLRSPAWNIWAEIEDPTVDYKNIAASLLPTPETGEKFWHEAAQTLFVDTAEGLGNAGQKSNKALFEAAARWTMRELEELVDSTASSRYINEKAEKTGLSVLSTMVQQVDVMRHMPDPKPGEKAFSIREWVRKQNQRKPGERGAMLFLLSDARYMGMMRNLISMWIDIAARELMASGDPLTKKAKTWLIVDELASMGKIPVLPDTITQARKYGMCHMVGFQTVGQLNHLYGKEMANTILTNCGTKLILRCDGENAKYWSDTIGEEEVWENNVSLSFSAGSERNSESVSRKRSRAPAVLASDLAGLPDLQGYLLLPGFAKKAKVQLNIRRMVQKHALYEPRSLSKSAMTLLEVMQADYEKGLAGMNMGGAKPASEDIPDLD